MFGKGARQIQADPTLDLTKCKCCDCKEGVVGCKGCMQGVTMYPGAGCCPSKDEALIFEYTRPEQSSSSACCRFPPTPGGSEYQCCTTTREEKENVRFSYHYVGRYFRLDYKATGNSNRNGGVRRWPANAMPRLCSYCDPASGNVGGQATCDCLDFTADASEDDPDVLGNCTIADGSVCSLAYRNCECQGSGIFKNTDRTSQRLSAYRKKEMEREPYYRWLLDIMCYNGGNVLFNPFIVVNEQEAPGFRQDNGTLYNHLVGVIHCEHWWELDRCDDNPNVDFASEGFPNINTTCLVPRFWIQACSGVPVFDWEFIDAADKGYIGADELQEVWLSMAQQNTPPQSILERMSAGGYFDTGDWRQEALNELNDLKGRTYTKNFYSNVPSPSSCSDLKYLGPVRKRYFDYETFPQGPFGIPAFLDPKKARKNIVNSNPYEEEESLQLPDSFIRNPWASGNYPQPPTTSSTPEQIEEYNDFVAWKNAQWVYMHARPGGWEYVCAAYFDGTEFRQIPDLPRRYASQVITCTDPEEGQILQDPFGGCLTAMLGVPQPSSTSDCGFVPPGNCPNATKVPCGSFSCFDIECLAEDFCAEYPEQGGGGVPCGTLLVESSCEGMALAYSRQSPRPCPSQTFALDDWYTTRFVKAWLYKVNITNGEFSSFCPHICRVRNLPKPITTDLPFIYAKRPAHLGLCRNWFDTGQLGKPPRCPTMQGIPDGKYCFGYSSSCVNFLPGGEICNENTPPFGCPFLWCYDPDNPNNEPPFYWGPNGGCCIKTPGGQIDPAPIPTNYTHPAFSNPACKQCGPGGGEGGVYGPNGCPTKGCCHDCCTNTTTEKTQAECYAGIDPNDPQYAHIIWLPHANGVNCINNPSPCSPSYPACP